MKVNIVWETPAGDRVLDRLARYLAEGTGWSVNGRPMEGVDINYFMVYIDYAQRFSDWRKTRIGAYFSHLELQTPYKKYWWEVASGLVEIKTVTAWQYAAYLPGCVHHVTPPIDCKLFDIREHRPNKVPVVGVSGFVDRSGRKGEAMVARLAFDTEGRLDVVASGEGWPVRKVNHDYATLPHFYNSLDVYLCSSSIEGVPMPPLEALACGIAVVIPRGVGMLDELPELAGIYRYEAGDYAAMREATERAVNSKKHDREALRKVITDTYIPEAWCNSHVAALCKEKSAICRGVGEPMRSSTGEIGRERDRHGKRGVYYVAYGEPARKCAQGAIASFKQHFPDIPVALASDKPLGAEDVFIQHPDQDIGGRAAKIKVYDLAPANWGYITYLDADTEIIAPNDQLWRIVEDGWDMVICKNPGRFHIAREMRRSDNGDECNVTFQQLGTDELIQFNGGVFCFQRNARTEAFFHSWYEEWLRWGKRDQGALLRALFAHPLKLFVLGNEWNTITRYDPAEKAAWLLHYPMTARRWRGVVHHRLDDPNAWKAVQEFERSKK